MPIGAGPPAPVLQQAASAAAGRRVVFSAFVGCRATPTPRDEGAHGMIGGVLVPPETGGDAGADSLVAARSSQSLRKAWLPTDEADRSLLPFDNLGA
ncbi:hypothetical protein GCM10010524_52770 [Streptomyces mexicanus]